jgi:hypothetical protein
MSYIHNLDNSSYDINQSNEKLNYQKVKNKPHHLSVFKNITGTNTFLLNEPLKDVIKVTLLNAYAYGNVDSSNWQDKYVVILHIDELQKNYGDNSSNNKLNNSFAILDNFKRISTDASTTQILFKNEYRYNQDIKYFDPPLNALSKLTCKIYDTENATTVSTIPLQLKLEFLVETKEKMRIY